MTAVDPFGLEATSSVSVTVSQTLASATVQLLSGLGAGGTESFAAAGLDQFGNPLASQPMFTWSVSGDGAISNTGVYTPPESAGTATIEATSGAVTGSYAVSFPGPAQLSPAASSTSWSTAAWTSAGDSAVGVPGLRGVSGDQVVFDSAAGGTVTLDGASPTLASVTFNSAGGYTIAQGSGGTLQLANGASPATIGVATGSDTISAPLALESNVTILPAAGSQLTLSGGVSGAGGLTLDEPGTVLLTGTNTYAGNTKILAGTLMVPNPSAIPVDTNLTINPGGTFIFDPTLQAAPATAVAPATQAISSSASVSDSVGRSPAASFAAIVAPPLALPIGASAFAPQANNPGQSVAAGALSTSAVDRVVGSSLARIAAADLAWLGQSLSGPDASDQHHTKDVAIQAVDAVFAQYGR